MAKINMIIPLLDNTNHHQPEFFNKSDLTLFYLQYMAPRLESDYYGAIVVKTNKTLFKVGEEFSYTYSPQIDTMELLKHYGFAIDNNIFAEIILKTSNYFNGMNDQQVSVCTKIQCVESAIEESDITVKSKGTDKQVLQFYFHKWGLS